MRTFIVLTLTALAAAAFCAIGSGCTHQGREFDIEHIKLIEEGVTTQDQILEYFGSPYAQRRLVSSDEVMLAWDYVYVPFQGQGANLTVYFDSYGVVEYYEYTLTYEE